MAQMAVSQEASLLALNEAALAITSERSLDGVLQRIAELARELVGAEYGALGVVDSEGVIVSFSTSGISDEQRAAIGALPKGRGLLGALIREGKPLRVPDISADPRSVGFPPNHPPMRNLLGIPILLGERVLGDLYLANKVNAAEFSQQDEELVLLLARHAAAAIENARLNTALEGRVRQFQALQVLGSAVSAVLELDAVLSLVVDRSMVLMRTTGAAIGFVEGPDLVYRVTTGRGAQALRDVRLPLSKSLAGMAITGGRPVVSRDLPHDPRGNARLAARVAVRDAVWVPLIAKGQAMGVLAVFDRVDEQPVAEEDAEVLQLYANQAAVAIENARLYERVQGLAVLEDRERIMRELHDGIIQSIYGVGLGLEYAVDLISERPEEARHRVRQAALALNEVLGDIRSYILKLGPSAEAGATPRLVLERIVQEFQTTWPHAVSFSASAGAAARLGAEELHHLAQVAREALANVVRHAQATWIGVELRVEGDRLRLRVADNGIGFDPRIRVDQSHFGLRDMRDRAHQLNGRLNLRRRSPTGTLLSFDVRVSKPD